MKKILTLILTAALCAAMTLPARAAANSDYGYGSLTLVDGAATISFSEARTEQKAIMLSRQTWPEGSAAALTSEAVRTDVNLIVLKPGSLVSKSADGGAMNLSFLTGSAAGYVVHMDRLSMYSLSFSSDLLFAYPFMPVAMCLLTLSDGSEYFLASGSSALAEAPPVASSYIVQLGDTLDGIALNYYGAPGLGNYLFDANPEHFEATGGILEAGRALTLPVQLNGIPRRSAPLAGENELIYIVKSGDTLAGIAQTYYGNSQYYNYIFQRNANILTNPGALQVGMVLVLPVITITNG